MGQAQDVVCIEVPLVKGVGDGKMRCARHVSSLGDV